MERRPKTSGIAREPCEHWPARLAPPTGGARACPAAIHLHDLLDINKLPSSTRTLFGALPILSSANSQLWLASFAGSAPQACSPAAPAATPFFVNKACVCLGCELRVAGRPHWETSGARAACRAKEQTQQRRGSGSPAWRGGMWADGNAMRGATHLLQGISSAVTVARRRCKHHTCRGGTNRGTKRGGRLAGVSGLSDRVPLPPQ